MHAEGDVSCVATETAENAETTAASWSSWFSGAQVAFNEKLQTGISQVMEQVEIGLRGIPPDESDNEDDAYTLSDAAQKQAEHDARKSSDPAAVEPADPVVVSQENISKQEVPYDEERSTDFNELVNEAARGASKWGIDSFMNIKSKGLNLMTDGLEILDTFSKQTLEQVTTAVCTTSDPCETTPTLSSALRDAKRASQSRGVENDELREAQQANFSSLFDEYKGLMSLEALESLSQESRQTVGHLSESLSDAQSDALTDLMRSVRKHFPTLDNSVAEGDLIHDFAKEANAKFGQLTVNIRIDSIIQVHDRVLKEIETYEDCTLKDTKNIHKTSIKSLAEYCAVAINVYHKLGQLILMDNFMDMSQLNFLREFNSIVIKEISNISNLFIKELHKIKHESMDISTIITPLTTDIYLEASNTRNYINMAYTLLKPIVQHSMLKDSLTSP